jgi:fatty-acyl-CoA synthase
LERRVSTVGTIHPHVEAKIVDTNGHVVPVGVRGELLTRGYGVMQGYWDEPQKTAETIDPHGWVHTAISPSWTSRGTAKSSAGSRI